MAVLSKHPVGAVPGPPARERTGHLMLRAWCIFVLFLAFSGVAWINAIGAVASGILTIATGVVTVVLWVRVRPPVQWRRLPWFASAYVVWAGISIIWSHWPGTTALTWLLLAITTLQALFVGAVLTWREVVAALASALKWCVGLSLAFEIAVSVFVRGPLLPEFMPPAPGSTYDPIVFWSRGNLMRHGWESLFDGGRIQGIYGNANPLAAVCLVAIIVFAVRIAARAPRRPLLIAWIVVAAFLLYRADSATVYLAAACCAAVLAAVLVMRTARTPGDRTRRYVLFTGVAIVGILGAWLMRDNVLSALGRSSELTGRTGIWQGVIGRAVEHPVIGWGFATPWLPSDPAFDRWIVDHGQSVMQAHNMWIDAWMQVGIIGVLLLAGHYLTGIWRSWFFAVDRPRWDLTAGRPYSALSVLPPLIFTMLLVQGFAESEPLLLWGWMLPVLLVFKIKQAPIVGVGPGEQPVQLERGEQPTPA
ncbi:ligase [Microbacterium mangrovi]|uniref:Ligase n=1 Tax=Microbacterium mangrovi TaxID=1348253 RepID=A0A0B2A5Y8_9MICO|nr:O-antigen ligase family protein [Microbacterium mangrovi]KHK98914.1 ligase [Microbacterium mangrovi]